MPIFSTLALLFALQAEQPAAWLDPDRTAPYLPPGYESSQRRYPVVYWLHGMGGSQRSGTKVVQTLDGPMRKGQAPEMIVVLVNGMRDRRRGGRNCCSGCSFPIWRGCGRQPRRLPWNGTWRRFVESNGPVWRWGKMIPDWLATGRRMRCSGHASVTGWRSAGTQGGEPGSFCRWAGPPTEKMKVMNCDEFRVEFCHFSDKGNY